jgi:hypothetical protein
LPSRTSANEQEKQQLEMFGEGIDSLVGIDGAYVAGAAVGGYFAWNLLNQKQ